MHFLFMFAFTVSSLKEKANSYLFLPFFIVTWTFHATNIKSPNTENKVKRCISSQWRGAFCKNRNTLSMTKWKTFTVQSQPGGRDINYKARTSCLSVCLYVLTISQEPFFWSPSHIIGVLLGTHGCTVLNSVQNGHEYILTNQHSETRRDETRDSQNNKRVRANSFHKEK